MKPATRDLWIWKLPPKFPATALCEECKADSDTARAPGGIVEGHGFSRAVRTHKKPGFSRWGSPALRPRRPRMRGNVCGRPCAGYLVTRTISVIYPEQKQAPAPPPLEGTGRRFGQSRVFFD